MSTLDAILKSLPASDLENPTIMLLIEIIHNQQEEISRLKDEIARLKGLPPRPKLRPSILEGNRSGKPGQNRSESGKKKRSVSRRQLPGIDEAQTVKAENVPPGSRFKGYERYRVQELIIAPWVIEYRRERWKTPDGRMIVAPLPKAVSGSHFGPGLRSFILHQHYDCAVTQNLIAKQLNQMGVRIGEGSVCRILLCDHDRLHSEKEALLAAGLKSPFIHADDTGARHKGKNGYCTHIGNPWFTFFETTTSKSRINFLRLLRGKSGGYALNDAALDYARKAKLPKNLRDRLSAASSLRFENKEAFVRFMEDAGIESVRHRRIFTEAALVGTITSHGGMEDTRIISDDAGQFNVFSHALCWVHAERSIAKLHGISACYDRELERVRGQIWDLYDEIKAYKIAPTAADKKRISERFDQVFNQATTFASLNQALRRIAANKSELLLVLEFPLLPLHNNLSERDIREYVKRRKVSGTTRSDLGRQCRDTFLSLKKTCQKHGLSFWDFLYDRIHDLGAISYLPRLVADSIPR